MLSREEKESIQQLKSWREYIIKHKEEVNKANDLEFYLRTVLNLITKLQKENDILKNHVHYKKCQKCGKEFRTKRNDTKYCDECKKDSNKEWYKNLTEEQKAKRREQAKNSMRKLRERRKNGTNK